MQDRAGILDGMGVIASTVDRFLAAAAAGRPTDLDALYARDAVLDATVPNWRSTSHGPAAIAAAYAAWFVHTARLEELERRAFMGGEVVTFLRTWEEHGVPQAAHHCHVLVVDAAGRIVLDQLWLGGRWDAGLLADMGAAAPY